MNIISCLEGVNQEMETTVEQMESIGDMTKQKPKPKSRPKTKPVAKAKPKSKPATMGTSRPRVSKLSKPPKLTRRKK